MTLGTIFSDWQLGGGGAITSVIAPLILSGGVLSIPLATSTVNGYLSAADWVRFNSATMGGVTGVGTIDSESPSANALVIVGGDIYAQSASATFPGMLNIAAQSLAGLKTFTNGLSTTSFKLTTGATLNYALISDASGNGTWQAITDGTVTSVTASSPLASSGGATPNITIQNASSSQNGALSSADWSTFNSKQNAGSYITSLTSDVTAAGPGSSAATVNSVGGSTASNIHKAEQTVNNSEAINLIFASPASGSAASPLFRSLVSADIGANLITNTQLAQMPLDTIKGNNTGITANASDLTTAQVTAMLNPFVGDTGTGGTQGLVPAPSALSALSGKYLSANGSFNYVDQSKNINPSFSLITQGSVPSGSPGTIKYESTTIFNSITTGKNYAVGVGFIGSPTLTIWDISNQTNPILTGTFVAAGGGAYNCTIGVVAGVQYAFVGYNSGSHFVVVNLTNPASPIQTSSTVITGSPGSIYGVSFLNGYVYCATQSTGLVVMDVGGGTGTPAIPVQTYQQAGGTKSFGVVAIGTNVYTTSYSTSSPYTVRQIESWTLSSPGTVSIPSLLQSLQVTAAGEALGLSVSGNTAFVTTAATGAYNINLVDITTPSSMTNLSQINSTNTFNSAFYAVANGNYLYIPSGANAIYGGAIDAYDITTRTTPIHIAQVTTNDPTSVFGGIALSGGYIFCADYGIVASNNGYLDVFSQILPNPIFGGATGSSIKVNSAVISGNLQYTKAPLVNGYVMTSDAIGNAIWAAQTSGSDYTVNNFTLTPTNITNKYVTLSSTPLNPTLTVLNIIGGIVQNYGVDFTITGSQLSWSSLGLDGVLVSGNILIVQFY